MSEQPDVSLASIIPPDQITGQDLIDWYSTVQEMNKLKQKEHFQRLRIFKFFFPKAKEGTNTFVLQDLHQLKGVKVVNREVQIAVVNTLAQQLVEAKIDVKELIEWKPHLKTGEYRKLTAEQISLFDQCLIIKDGSPQLKIEPPSAKALKAQAAAQQAAQSPFNDDKG